MYCLLKTIVQNVHEEKMEKICIIVLAKTTDAKRANGLKKFCHERGIIFLVLYSLDSFSF